MPKRQVAEILTTLKRGARATTTESALLVALCADLAAMRDLRRVTVSGSDPHDLDPDGDGIACD